MTNIIEIKGIKYQQKEQKRESRMSPKMVGLLSLFMAIDPFTSHKKEPERPQVDIIKEFELIQNKKSNLSKSQRDWVERMFYKNFKEISI